MTEYVDKAHKNNALRELAAKWERLAALPQDGSAPAAARGSAAGQAKAYTAAARELRTILDTPVADPAMPVDIPPVAGLELVFTPDDLTVVVVAPEGVFGRGMPRSLFLGPNDEVPLETLSPFTRLVVGAMLDHARGQLDD